MVILGILWADRGDMADKRGFLREAARNRMMADSHLKKEI
jgi:hypothetical protein